MISGAITLKMFDITSFSAIAVGHLEEVFTVPPNTSSKSLLSLKVLLKACHFEPSCVLVHVFNILKLGLSLILFDIPFVEYVK